MPGFATVKSLSLAAPHKLRVLESVRRVVEGQDLDLVGTIAANLMLDVVLLDHDSHTIEHKETMIDEMAAALKTALRVTMEGDGSVQ